MGDLKGWANPAHPAHHPGSGPPRRYAWAPFAPGNSAAERHGAHYPKKVDPLTRELVEYLTTLMAEPGSPIAYLGDATYGHAVWAWGRAEARIQLVVEWLMDQDPPGPLDRDGNVRPAATYLDRLEKRAENLRATLGLDPLSRAKLGRDAAAAQVDIAQLFARMADEEQAAAEDDGKP